MKYNINYLMNKVHVCDTDSRELDEDDWEEILFMLVHLRGGGVWKQLS